MQHSGACRVAFLCSCAAAALVVVVVVVVGGCRVTVNTCRLVTIKANILLRFCFPAPQRA